MPVVEEWASSLSSPPQKAHRREYEESPPKPPRFLVRYSRANVWDEKSLRVTVIEMIARDDNAGHLENVGDTTLSVLHDITLQYFKLPYPPRGTW